jgi:hypothetical protein
MKYSVEMGSGAMTYIRTFVEIGSGLQKLPNNGKFTDTQTAQRSHNRTLGKYARNYASGRQFMCLGLSKDCETIVFMHRPVHN